MSERPQDSGKRGPVKGSGGRPALEPGDRKDVQRSIRLRGADWKAFDRLCFSKGGITKSEFLSRLIALAGKVDLDSF